MDRDSGPKVDGTEEHYDDRAFLFVVISFLSVILVPWTLSLLSQLFSSSKSGVKSEAARKQAEHRAKIEDERLRKADLAAKREAERAAVLAAEAAASTADVDGKKTALLRDFDSVSAYANEECYCAPCEEKRAHVIKVKRRPSSMAVCKYVLFGVLWLIVLLCIYSVIYHEDPNAVDVQPFNPFEILGVSESADARTIRKAFHKLGRVWHPDKVAKDDEEGQQRILDINKAYETLTNEQSRLNWEQYGNPDGRQAYTVGMALPKWLVNQDNSTLVLLGYLLIFIVILPALVVMMWWRWKEVAPNQVLYNTMGIFHRFITTDMRHKKMIDLLSAAQEYKDMPIRKDDADQLKLYKEKMSRLPTERKPPKNNVFRQEIAWPYAQKLAILFHLHLNRMHDVLTPANGTDLREALGKAHHLLNGMVTILAEGRGLPAPLTPVLESIKLAQMITQACWPDEELLQLPHINGEWQREMVKKRWRNTGGTLRGFLDSSMEQKRKLLLGEEELRNRSDYHFLDERNFQDVMTVCAQFPTNIDISVECVVEDEHAFISEKSVVSVFVSVKRLSDEEMEAKSKRRAERLAKKEASVLAGAAAQGGGGGGGGGKGKKKKGGRFQNVKQTKATQGDPSSSESTGSAAAPGGGDADDEKAYADTDYTEEEDDDDADEGGAKKTTSMSGMDAAAYDRMSKERTKPVDKIDVPVHCPFYPFEKAELWYVLLADQTGKLMMGIKKLAVNPVGVRTEDVKMQFVAPDKPGKYCYYVFLKSDSYLGCDQRVPVHFEVLPAPEIPEMDVISDSDDDAALDDDDDIEIDDEEALAALEGDEAASQQTGTDDGVDVTASDPLGDD